MSTLFWSILSLFIGAFFGMLIASLCVASKRGEESPYWWNEKDLNDS